MLASICMQNRDTQKKRKNRAENSTHAASRMSDKDKQPNTEQTPPNIFAWGIRTI